MTDIIYDIYAEQSQELNESIRHAISTEYEGDTAFQTLRGLFTFIAQQPENTEYVCFGTGALFLTIWQSGLLSDVITRLVDNDQRKQGTLIQGLEVISPDSLSVDQGHRILVASSYEAEITQQLVDKGFSASHHIFNLMPLFKSIGWLHKCDVYRLSNNDQ